MKKGITSFNLGEKDRLVFLNTLLDNYCEDWRHFNTQIWQIPSVAIGINSLLISQALNNDYVLFFRKGIIIIAFFTTFVLLIATVKHRLIMRAKDNKKRILLKDLGLAIYDNDINFSSKDELINLGENTFFITKIFSRASGYRWLVRALVIVLNFDIYLFIKIN